jgi:hypothetical protein
MTSLAVAWNIPLYPSANGAAMNHKPTTNVIQEIQRII